MNSLALSTMIICSYNTILFNANPLLRYDGYYVMADWLEIPNLRIKSTQFFTYLFQEKVLGLEIPVQSYLPRSRRFLFVFYAVASYLYRWWVTFFILKYLYVFLKPYKLGSISAMMAIGSLIPLLGMPMYQMFKFARTPGRMRKVKKARAASFAVVAVATVAGILLIPTPLRVQGPMVLTAAKPAVIYAEVPGRLMKLNVRDGEWVKKGTVLAELSNPEKVREEYQLREQHDVSFAKARWYHASDSRESRALERQQDQMATELEPAIDKVGEQIAKLQLEAPRDGMAIGVRLPETVGSYLKPDKPFCEIGDPHHLEAHMFLDQGDIDLIKLNKRAWVKVYGNSEITLRSKVGEIAKRNREEIPLELSNVAGGEIATKQDQKTGQAKPQTAIYEVIIPLENPHLSLQPGLRGFAKIDGGTHTLGWWLMRLILKTFNFSL
jgi:putative peptide zinc metalloprotease protein